MRGREGGQGIYENGEDWGRSMFGRERKGINWTCFRHVKFEEEPSLKAQNLVRADASVLELKLLKATASWSVLK